MKNKTSKNNKQNPKKKKKTKTAQKRPTKRKIEFRPQEATSVGWDSFYLFSTTGEEEDFGKDIF